MQNVPSDVLEFRYHAVRDQIMNLVSSCPLTGPDACWLLFEYFRLKPWKETNSIHRHLPDRFPSLNLKVVQYVFLLVKKAESGHSVEAAAITG